MFELDFLWTLQLLTVLKTFSNFLMYFIYLGIPWTRTHYLGIGLLFSQILHSKHVLAPELIFIEIVLDMK